VPLWTYPTLPDDRLTVAEVMMLAKYGASSWVGRSRPAIAICLLSLAACDAGAGDAARWAGTIDTLPSGQVVVQNPATPIWRAGEEWGVVEELRIGGVGGTGPEVFGSVSSITVDPAGRIWVLDGQAQEVRVFDADGQHVRTVGRRGGGPGEFQQAVHIALAPDGNVWVMDPSNARLSVFDTAGAYVEGKAALGGFVMMPWPGRFDEGGRYYSALLREGRWRLVRHDASFLPLDTVEVPRDPVSREWFEIRDSEGRPRLRAAVPYQGFLDWQVSPAGTMWALIADQYRLFELDSSGDTVRSITRSFAPLSVTAIDRERAREDMKWFTEQGGRFDPSRLPAHKPPVRGFFFDDKRHVWVERTVDEDEELRRVFDVFDPDGRFLGTVHLPFPLWMSAPVVRDGRMFAVTRDELDVPYVVRARIVR
jgi:hypothetical protein